MDQLIEFVSNHAILSGVWVVLVIWLVFGFINSQFSPVKEISTHDATLLMNKQDAVVLDIRSANEYKKGHILGAKQVATEQVNKGDFKNLENHKGKPIIVVCAMGMSAKPVATRLLKAGFDQVSVLRGGMNTWLGAGLPTSK